MSRPPPDASVDSTDAVLWRSLPQDAPAKAAPVEVTFGETEQPRRIGVYDLGEEVGRGAFGTVYRATDTRDGRGEVAVKVFGGRMTTREAEVRFQREVEIAARLDHPNISSILGYGVEAGNPYIVMRLIRGETLLEKVEREGVSAPGEAARILARLTVAIEHAHSRNVVHRDLKPSNVILEQNEPVVVDLGLSKSLIATDSFTGKGDLLGSPLFMAPEQLFGERADERSDVYGLGGLLYYLLTGQTPRRLEDFRKRATPEPRLPREVPPGLARIALKALAAKPSWRYRSAAEMGAALEAWIAGRDLEPPPRRPRLLTATLAALAGAALLLLLWPEARAPRVTLDQNTLNTYEVAGAPLVIKDGRVTLGRDLEPRFPCLKVILGHRETWSPPAQRLEAEQDIFLGRSIGGGAVLARLSFFHGPTPIQGRARFEVVPVEAPELLAPLWLKPGADGRLAGQAGALELAGVLRGADERGLIWGHEASEQLVASVAGAPQWSPPRPMDRTDFGVDYPLGAAPEGFLLGRFQSPDEGAVRVELRRLRRASEGGG